MGLINSRGDDRAGSAVPSDVGADDRGLFACPAVRPPSPQSGDLIWMLMWGCRPFGTIIANEIFSSGVLLSEYVHPPSFIRDSLTGWVGSTDFRQFEQYLNVSGLDVSHSLMREWGS
jgi:hypothetical protein